MNRKLTRRFSRREFLKLGGGGAAVALLGSALPAAAGAPTASTARIRGAMPPAQGAPVYMRLAATDGFINLPGRPEPNDLYVFGFSEAGLGTPIGDLDVLKGRVQNPAPVIGLDWGAEFYLTLTNIGLTNRPDLDDSHTVHWHGFRNPTALFDGVPEVSIAVPVNRDFVYFYRAEAPGTYMYHCHFEDVEHIQMGMGGVIFIRPAQNGTPILDPLGSGKTFTRYVYDDANGITGYEREFALLLSEVDTRPHDGLLAIQEFVWSSYKPNYWIINGRAYPDTVLPDGALPDQPISALMEVNAGERVLMRLANLGYEQHAMVMPGIPMRVVGEDATLLRGPNGADLSYWTNTLYIGPGEARDVIFTAPAHSGGIGPDVYQFKNRSYHRLSNNGAPGPGGMMTEVRVYPLGAVPPQTTYP